MVGKTASCAAMAMTFAAYAVPGDAWVRRLVATLPGVAVVGGVVVLVVGLAGRAVRLRLDR